MINEQTHYNNQTNNFQLTPRGLYCLKQTCVCSDKGTLGYSFGGMMHRGYVAIWRKIIDTSFYQDSETVHLAIHLLLKANHKDKRILYNGVFVDIKRGELISGRNSLSVDIKIPPTTIRRKLQILKSEGFLDIKSNNKYSLITICNYREFQSNLNSKTDSKRTANGQQTDSKRTQTITNKNKENINKTLINNKGVLFVDCWNEFLVMRKKIGKPTTDHAKSLLLKEVEKLSGGSEALQVEIINQSTSSCWTGFYPLKDNKGGINGKYKAGYTEDHAGDKFDGIGEKVQL